MAYLDLDGNVINVDLREPAHLAVVHSLPAAEGEVNSIQFAFRAARAIPIASCTLRHKDGVSLLEGDFVFSLGDVIADGTASSHVVHGLSLSFSCVLA